MAKKDNIDLDDFDLDDFDFDVPEWGGDEIDGKSRSPIENVLSGAVDGAKSELGPGKLKDTLVLALPSGYGLASDTVGSVASDAKSLYDTITGESPELVKISKNFGRKAMHLAGNKVLPKKVADRLNSALEKTESDAPLKSDSQLAQEQEQAEFDQIAEIFRAKAQADETRAKQDELDSVEQKALDQVRFQNSMAALESINTSIARLVGYQDSVTARYQQKMLEINYRQQMTSKQVLDLLSVSTGKSEKILEAIRHNTALPEAVKIRGSELFGLTARQRLADGGLNLLSNFSRNYSKQIYANARAMIGGTVGDISQLQNEVEGSDISKSYILGSTIGSGVTSKIRDFGAMHVAPMLERNKHIARGNEKLRGVFSGLPQKINEYASSETKGTGLRSVLEETFKRFLPQFALDTRLGGETLLDMDQPAIYDRLARRSIIEIIPGHLADIAHWTKALATGEVGPKEVYNPVRGGFSTEAEQQQDVGRQIISLDERNNLRNAVDDFTKTIGVDGLSGKSLETLKRKLLTELAGGRDLVPGRLADGASYPDADPDTIDEITTAIRDSFNLDLDGKQLDTSTEGTKRFNDIRDQFYRMANMVPGITDRIRTFGDTVGRNTLRQLGYIERDGLTDRINIDTAWDTILRPPEEGEDGRTNLDEDTRPDPGKDLGTALRRLINRPVADHEPVVEPSRASVRALDATEEERRYRRRPVKLERYLGDKSTLIQILTQSRDYHAELVELVKASGFRGPAPSGTSRVDAIRELGSSAVDRLGEYANKAGDKATLLKGKAREQWKLLEAQLRELREQGREHPLAKEAELWLGETRDSLDDRVEWLKNYRPGGTDTRYQERYGNGLFGPRSEAGHDGSIQGRVRNWKGQLMEHERTQQAQKYLQEKSARLSTLYQDRSKHLDTLRDQAEPTTERVKGALKEQKRTFRPRLNALMRKFTGGKLGLDITSELTGDPEQDNLTIGLRNAQLQYEILQQVTPDEIRKGSFRELMLRKKGVQGEEEEDDKKEGGPGTLGLDKLKDLLGGGEGGLLSGLMDGILDLAAVKALLGDSGGSGTDPRTRREQNRNRRRNAPRAKGRIGRIAQMVRGAGGAALDYMGKPGQIVKAGLKAPGAILRSGGAKMLGRGVGWVAKKAALGVGGALLAGASFVGAPVLAAGLAAVGAVWTGIEIYKWIKGTDKIPPLSRLRMVQYGVEPDPKSKAVQQLLALEQLFKKHTRIGAEGRAQIDVKAIPPEALAEILDLDLEMDPAENTMYRKAIEYLNGRFAAVYMKWVGEYHAVGKTTDLSTVDDKLVGDEAIAFVDKVAMKDRRDIYSATTNPFEKDGFFGESKLPMSQIHLEMTVDEVKEELEKASKKRDAKPVSVMGFTMDARGNATLGGVWKKTRAEYQAEENARAEAEGREPRTLAEPSTAAQAAMQAGLTSKSNLAMVATAASAVGGVGMFQALRGLRMPSSDATTSRGRAVSVMGMDIGPRGRVSLATGMAAVGTRISARDVTLDDGRSVRYRVYGLTEMDAHKAAQLATLEDSLWGRVRYKDGQAQIGSGTSDEVEILNRLRGEVFTYTSRQEMLDQASWLRERFVTAFLAYCTAVRKRANIDAREAHVKLEATDFLEVLRETSQATGFDGLAVWEMTQSPWPNYVLNKDPASITDALSVVASRAGSKLLREPEGIQQGRVKDADGNWVDVDPTQANRPSPKDDEERARQQQQEERKEALKAEEEKGSLWSRFKGMFGKDEDKKAPQQGALNTQGQSVHPDSNQQISLLRSSLPISHPGGGTGGDVNDIPEPKGDGWEANKETLMAAANMVGVDPQLAASIAGVESNYRPNAVPYRNPRRPELGVLSSAASYYQVISGTWKELMGKYAKKYGIAPETTQHDPRANALLGLEYVRENVDRVKGAVSGRPVAATDAYLAHFLGPGGARRFLSAPPNAPAAQHVQPSQASSNPGIFRPGGRLQSVAQVYTDFDEKLKRHAKPDAPTVAAQLRSEAERAPDEYSEDGELIFTAAAPATERPAADTAAETSVQATATEMPSMVRSAVVESVVPDTEYQAPATPNAPDMVEQATTRATNNATRSLAMTARAAEAQSSAQAQAQVKGLGSSEEGVKRLVGINESQLEQLVSLVELIRSGITVKTETTESDTPTAPGPQGPTRINNNINTPRAAQRGTVSVGRA